jgi:hypothetical protein
MAQRVPSRPLPNFTLYGEHNKENSNTQFHERIKGLTAASIVRRQSCEPTSNRTGCSKLGWQGGSNKFGVGGVLEERVNGQLKLRTPSTKEKEQTKKKECERTPRDSIVLNVKREAVVRESRKNKNWDDEYIVVTDSESEEDESQLQDEEEEPIEEVDLVDAEDEDQQDGDETQTQTQDPDGSYARMASEESEQVTTRDNREVVKEPGSREQENGDKVNDYEPRADGNRARDTMSKCYAI